MFFLLPTILHLPHAAGLARYTRASAAWRVQAGAGAGAWMASTGRWECRISLRECTAISPPAKASRPCSLSCRDTHCTPHPMCGTRTLLCSGGLCPTPAMWRGLRRPLPRAGGQSLSLHLSSPWKSCRCLQWRGRGDGTTSEGLLMWNPVMLQSSGRNATIAPTNSSSPFISKLTSHALSLGPGIISTDQKFPSKLRV